MQPRNQSVFIHAFSAASAFFLKEKTFSTNGSIRFYPSFFSGICVLRREPFQQTALSAFIQAFSAASAF